MKLKHPIAILFIVLIGMTANAQWKKNKDNEDTKIWRYDLECEGFPNKKEQLYS